MPATWLRQGPELTLNPRESMRLPLPARLSRPVAFAMLTRGWGVVSTAITILILIRFVGPVLQGYYYSFLSLLLLQQLLQAGLAIVLLQFVSHEWLGLRLAHGEVVGDPSARSRLASLVRLSRRGFLAIAAGVLILLILAGPLLFSGRADANVEWLPAWLLVSVATAGGVLILPMVTTLEATGQVDVQQRALFTGNLVGTFAGWLALAIGWGLYAIAVIAAVRTIVTAGLLLSPYQPFRRLAQEPAGPSIPFREIWTLQWRITFSWLFGLLIYQSVVPIAFRVQGPVIAGQLGVMVQGFNAILSVAGAWLVPAQPEMGRRAAARDYAGLRELTDATTIRCVVTAIVLAVGAFSSVLILDFAAPSLGARFGDLTGLLALFVLAIVLQPASVMASAVRFQKKEPFLTMGLVCSIVAIISIAVGGYSLGLHGIVLAFVATIGLGVIPWTILIYRREVGDRRGSTAVAAS
jgi:hypothetical protein